VAENLGGPAALFAAVPAAFTVVWLVGAAYLIYLGVQMIRHRKGVQSEVSAGGGGMSGRRVYLNGLLTNLLNPKMVTFTIAFLPSSSTRNWVRSGCSSRSAAPS
jgi:threonine/homoserine/homoserine lactone efflux protein